MKPPPPPPLRSFEEKDEFVFERTPSDHASRSHMTPVIENEADRLPPAKSYSEIFNKRYDLFPVNDTIVDG